jgi:hypothetical protein
MGPVGPVGVVGLVGLVGLVTGPVIVPGLVLTGDPGVVANKANCDPKSSVWGAVVVLGKLRLSKFSTSSRIFDSLLLRLGSTERRRCQAFNQAKKDMRFTLCKEGRRCRQS